jgi:hypothetical protein
MAYTEIINEIQEQINEIQAQYDLKLLEQAEIEEELPRLLQQIDNLQQLKTQASTLSQAVDLNVNLRVTGESGGVAVVNHSVS